MDLLKQFQQTQKRIDLPDVRSGDHVKISWKVKEPKRERTQNIEGIVLSRKHGTEPGATITIRKQISGMGIEWTIPINSPLIQKLEIAKREKVRRAKLYYLRKLKGTRRKIKTIDIVSQ